jgi:hypothetical protein
MVLMGVCAQTAERQKQNKLAMSVSLFLVTIIASLVGSSDYCPQIYLQYSLYVR